MIKKVIILFVALLLVATIPAVSAESLAFVNILQKDVVSVARESITVDVRVTNLGPEEETFNLVVLDIDWIVGPRNTIITVTPGKSEDVQVTVTPSLRLDPGKYLLRIAATPASGGVAGIGETIVEIKSPPSDISVALVNPQEKLSSTSANTIRVLLQNNKNYEEKDLTLRIKGGTIDEKIPIGNLDGGERKQAEHSFYLESGTPPGELKFTFELIKGKDVIKTIQKTFVVSADELISESESREEVFLQKSSSIQKVNQGNIITGAAITREIGLFDRMFTRFDPLPSDLVRKGGSYTVEWAFSLEPGTSYTVTQVTNYQIGLIILLIIIILGVSLYFLLRGKILIHKKLITLRKGKEGAEIKVVLNLRNRGGTMHGVKVMDKVPAFAALHKDFGTVKPSEIKKAKNGTLIVWNIDKFSKNEEVILSYQIGCKLRIIGSFMLPRAMVSFKRAKKTVRGYSSPLVLTSEKE